jgi:hypothetical protein
VLVLSGILLDVGLRTAADEVALLAAVVTVALGLVTIGDVRSTTGRVLVGAATVPAAFLCVRASPWLLVLDVLAIGLLLGLGCSSWPGHRLFELRFAQGARLLGSTAGSLVGAPARIVTSVAAILPAPGEHLRVRYAAIGRGLCITVPVVAILALLLASADAVFASLIDLPRDADLGGVPAHVAVAAAGMWLAAGFFVHAGREQKASTGEPPFVIGPVEGGVVLGGLITVYALFALARLLVGFRGDRYVQETTGLTYAAYARSGFFQLLWAAGITLVVLLGLRAVVVVPTGRSRHLIGGMSLIAVVLTLVAVRTAIVRLDLYEDAFGLTMLRLHSTLFAWWIGAVFVLTGLALAGPRRHRRKLPGAVLCSALVVLLLVNVMDPERVVIERNVQRHAEGAEFDLHYALTLSDDAVPTLVELLPELDPVAARAALRALCPAGAEDERASWNRSRRAADRALQEPCSGH